ncbi:MAG: hypothetical protein Q4D02_01915 [Clostridia bacterium]|nr:hypothetical protein [Clostridia bacterium]
MKKYKCEKGEEQYNACKKFNVDYCTDCPHGVRVEDIEEDIKIIKESYIMTTKHCLDDNNKILKEAIENVLKELEKRDNIINNTIDEVECLRQYFSEDLQPDFIRILEILKDKKAID